jgi:hypothetical protein
MGIIAPQGLEVQRSSGKVGALLPRLHPTAAGTDTGGVALTTCSIAKHTKVDMIWVAGRSPTLVSQNLKATTLTYL